MSRSKLRLDVLLYQRELFPSREAARRAVMAGLVKHGDDVLDKPGLQVHEDISVSVTGPLHPYVGRGGLKLERAIKVFDVRLEGRFVVDVGASTGGFTDCALQQGAAHVYAIDVGYGSLAWKLRSDERVTVLERTNFRHLDPLLLQPRPSAAVMDVSFISAGLLFPKLVEVLTPPFDIICLVKPQFEAGRADVGKGGVVRDANVHRRVLSEHRAMGEGLGLELFGMTYSPITGGDGNIEYLAWWQEGHHRSNENGAGVNKSGIGPADDDKQRTNAEDDAKRSNDCVDVDQVVHDAWEALTTLRLS